MSLKTRFRSVWACIINKSRNLASPSYLLRPALHSDNHLQLQSTLCSVGRLSVVPVTRKIEREIRGDEKDPLQSRSFCCCSPSIPGHSQLLLPRDAICLCGKRESYYYSYPSHPSLRQSASQPVRVSPMPDKGR